MNNSESHIMQLWQNVLKNADKNKPHYTILLPPPNITGSLHIGHFLNWSIQDLMMRNAYMDGFYPNWIPGIDHAGIATQFVVERKLAENGESRHSMGREKFTEKIWEWKKEAENLITEQALSFGFFFDWSKKRFTMDDEYREHVINVFCKLYNDGLIKKSERVTNWDTNFKTAISDLEVTEKIEKKPMYVITFFAEDYEHTGDKIEIGTTRPEVMFANAAVAVHPDDERYKKWQGANKTFLIPLINKPIPIIFDERCEMEKGTGVLQITPAHGVIDNQIAQTHAINEFTQCINQEGKLFNIAPSKFHNLMAAHARPLIAKELEENGYLVETRPWEGIVYYPEKSPNNPMETIITQQWFLDVSKMAEEALENADEVEFIPDNIKNTFAYWMNHIQPWCISRQIWWGHRIPIWYKKDGMPITAHNIEEAIKLAGTDELEQETDVLDTWFSSALWPIGTQEKPTKDFSPEFTPTDFLVTGKDILFFWVARMMMFNLHLKNKIPFKKVYFNGIVRDANNQKMSKTKGNVLNPLDLKKEYGNDALRFALLRKASFGKDIAISVKEIEDGRAFSTKIRNSTKFIKEFMSKDYKPDENMDAWMNNKITQSQAKIKQFIKECAFHEACKELYDLFWNNFCAWYIEGCKVNPSARATEFLCKILQTAHPIVPWISEECFQTIENSKSILDYQAEFFIEKKCDFENIIDITKLLRKLFSTAECKSFYIKDWAISEKVKFFTKLSIDESCDFEFIISNITIKIHTDTATKAKTSIEKELSEQEKEYAIISNKIAKANNVPQEIILEWEERANNLTQQINLLKNWSEKFI